MDRIEKFMLKLVAAQRAKVRAAYVAIVENRLGGLDIKPLQGKQHWFRCRVGNVRIIFVRTAPGTNVITEVDFRGKIYKRM